MSLIRDGFDAWRECRAEYEELRWAAYITAEHDTRGALLNAKGRAKDIDPVTLFMGPETRARAYASEELLEHWATHPRITYQQYEKQWQQAREAERP